MTEQEKVDLEVVQAETKKLKIECFDHCLMFLRMPPEQLPHTGHKSIEAGIVWTVKKYQDAIEKQFKAYIRKYPDEGIRSK